jgi:NAD(P)-dependent dehydrogenase (short-subunit alcohol dehydrogenase family)
LADEFIARGKRVIIAGRRQANLDAFVEKHGADKCVGVQMDITDYKSIPGKIQECMSAFGGDSVDSVYVGSGIQKTVDFSKPESIDMEVVEMEFNTNYVRSRSYDSRGARG